MPAEIFYMTKRLEKLATNCGVMKKEDEQPQVDTSNMSKYEKQQYHVAVIMQRLRNNIAELDNLGDKAPIQKKSELSQAIRKDLEKMKAEAAKAKLIAKEDGKKDEYETLVGHVKKTEALYTSRFLAAEDTSGAMAHANGRTSKIATLDEEMRPMVNLRDDEEFQVFFDQVQKNDQEMDAAMDRISKGLEGLLDQAVGINQTIRTQNEILTETEAKTQKVNTKLVTLNKKLKKTIKEVEKDKLCIYLICFILLLALGGAIYWQITQKK